MQKNTVSPEGQVKIGETIYAENPGDKGMEAIADLIWDEIKEEF